MPECIKENCRLWKRSQFKGCSLTANLELVCKETGEFQHPKQKEAAIEWEDVKPFSMLDLARIGIDDTTIFEFWRTKMQSSPVSPYSAVDHQLELTNLGILGALEINGFVKRVVASFNPGDCIRTCNGVLMVIESCSVDIVKPDSFVTVVDDEGTVWAASDSYLSAGTRVEAVWQGCDDICKQEAQ